MEAFIPDNQFILNKRLFKAVVRNDIKDIRRLIDLKADINAEFTANELITDKILDEFAISIIMKDFRFFKRTGHHTVIKKENANTGFTLSPLQLAILYGWKEVIIELIRKGANPNQLLDIYNVWSNLHLMHSIASVFKNDNYSVKSDKDIIQLLFDHGADPNIQDNFGATSLHAAVCIQKRDDFEEYLKGIEKTLINGANPNLSDSSGTVLWYLLENMADDTESKDVIKLLLDHAVDPRGCKLSKEFHQRVEKNLKLIKAINVKDESKVRILLNNGTSPNIRDKDGLSALHIAVKLEDYAITELLLENGANPNTKSWKNGTTPLFNAVISNWMNIAELLLKHGANPSVVNTKGLSPLYFSITSNSEKMTELLLKYKANSDISRQVSVLFMVINEVKNDRNLKVVDNTLVKIKDIAIFLKSKGIVLDYTLFYQSIEIAEENGRKNIAQRIMELLDELTLN